MRFFIPHQARDFLCSKWYQSTRLALSTGTCPCTVHDTTPTAFQQLWVIIYLWYISSSFSSCYAFLFMHYSSDYLPYVHFLSILYLALSDSSSLVQQFHHVFISYAIKHEFINLLYLYLDYYRWTATIESLLSFLFFNINCPNSWSFILFCLPFRLALDSNTIKALGLSSSSLPPWVDLMLHCRLAAVNPTGRSCII